MAVFDYAVYEEDFTDQQYLTINHNLNLYHFRVRLVVDGLEQNQLITKTKPDEVDPRNTTHIYFQNIISGRVQILAGSPESVNCIPLEDHKHIKPLAGNEYIEVVSGTESIYLNADGLTGSLSTTSGTLQTQITVNLLTSAGGAIVVSEPLSITTSTNFQEKLSLNVNTATVTSGLTDQYRLVWYYEWGYESASAEFNSRIQVDNIDDVGGINWRPSATSADTFAASSGFIDMTLSSGTHNFDLDYRSTSGGKAARIQRARLSLSRVALFPGQPTPPQRGTP